MKVKYYSSRSPDVNRDQPEMNPAAHHVFCMKPRQTTRTRFVQPGLTGIDISFVGIRYLLTRPVALLIHSLAARITMHEECARQAHFSKNGVTRNKQKEQHARLSYPCGSL
jgi:hypothetical protein